MTFGRLLACAVLALAACDAHTTGPELEMAGAGTELTTMVAASAADNGHWREVHEGFWDLSDVYWSFDCEDGTSELVDMEGGVRHRMVMMRDAAGGFHVQVHAVSMGLRGTGVESGEEYRARELRHETWNDNGMANGSTYIVRVSLIGRDSGKGFEYNARVRYQVNANDEVVVEVLDENYSCRI